MTKITSQPNRTHEEKNKPWCDGTHKTNGFKSDK